MSTYLHLHQCPPDSIETGSFQHMRPQAISRKLRTFWQKTPLYGLTLSSKGIQDLCFIPNDSWPGSFTEGQRLLEGKIVLGSETVLLQQLWFPDHLSQSALADLHSFDWLRNLRSLGDNAARRVARQLILDWISKTQNWKTIAWRPDIVGHRLSNWVALYEFFCASADQSFRQYFFRSLYRQLRHLKRCWQDAPSAPQRLYALHGLIHTVICVEENPSWLPKLLKHLEKLIHQQILEDGGHISRSPSIQFMILRLLIDLRSLLRQTKYLDIGAQVTGNEKGETLSTLIHKAIVKMAPLVRLFRHGDGSLACFGPYSRINPSLVDMVLTLADVKGRPPTSASHMGFERCSSKTGLVLMNLRPSPLRSPSHTPSYSLEKGTGIFMVEWSTTRRRIITYSDMVLQSTQISASRSPLFAQAKEKKTDHFSFDRETYPEGSLLEAQYQSHNPLWPYSQARRLFLNNRHLDFRGEDEIISHLEGLYALRFVFHPDLEVMLQGNRVNIETPEGQKFHFLSNTDEIHLERLETAYPAYMLLLLGKIQTNHPTKILWSFKSVR